MTDTPRVETQVLEAILEGHATRLEELLSLLERRPQQALALYEALGQMRELIRPSVRRTAPLTRT